MPPPPTTSGSAPAAEPPIKSPSRCSLPGYKKSQREAQARELGAGAGASGAAAPPPPPAASRTAFTSAAACLSKGVMDMLREVDPDVQARMLDKWEQHNRDLRSQARRHG